MSIIMFTGTECPHCKEMEPLVKKLEKEIDQIVWDIVHNKLSAVELTYFVAACYTNVLTMDETIYLIKSMVK